MGTHLIIGGRWMGKRAWAEAVWGPLSPVCDLALAELEDVGEARMVVGLHEGARVLMQRGEDPVATFMGRMGALRGRVLIGDEVGGGVIPMDPSERAWRDAVGLLYQALAREADIVDRVWAGLPHRLKGPPIEAAP